MRKYLSLATRTANKSTARQSRHGVVILSGGNVLSVGSNKQLEHAERVAIRLLRGHKRRNLRMLSVRILADGSFAMARPCTKCSSLISKYNIAVYYTNSDGDIIRYDA